MHDNISTALITAFEQHYDTRWDDAQLRNERLAWRAAWDAAGAAPAAVAGVAPAGWRLVPATPTRDWIAAVADGVYEYCDCSSLIADILSRAPAAPALEAPAAPARDLALIIAALEHGQPQMAHYAEPRERHAQALAAAEANGHSEDDCVYTSDIICPYCATKQNSDDRHESAQGLECDTCGGKFDLEVEWSPSYTTTKARAQAQQKGPHEG